MITLTHLVSVDPRRLWEVIRLRMVVIQDSYEEALRQMQQGGGMDDDDEDGQSDASDESWEDEPDYEACVCIFR